MSRTSASAVVKIGMSYLPTIRSRSTNPGAVEIQMSQAFGSRPSWLTLIINPSSLLAGHYQPTQLFQPHMDFLGMKLFLSYILKDIGVSEPLKTFKLSRCDLTCNLYYESRADVRKRLEIVQEIISYPPVTV